MHRTRRALEVTLGRIDLVLEMVDARLPGSSTNPLLSVLAPRHPRLVLLNKSDLADAALTARWLDFFRQHDDTMALAVNAVRLSKPTLLSHIRRLIPHRGGLDKPMRILVFGVPNVGKSTLLNSIIGRKSAKTGDTPGLTRAQQRLLLADDCWLYDTPGMLWPNIEIVQSGYNLAAVGSIGANAWDEEDVAAYLAFYLGQHYPERMYKRYGVPADEDGMQWLLHMASKVGLMRSGQGDAAKAAARLLGDVRSGRLGRISLETPEQWQSWQSTSGSMSLSTAISDHSTHLV